MRATMTESKAYSGTYTYEGHEVLFSCIREWYGMEI